jgi:AcrR family transcriptional regulator
MKRKFSTMAMKQPTAISHSGRREREAARRRADVLDVATGIFAEKGHEGTQISEIARVAEVSLATLYAMFKSKDELFQAVLVRAAESIRETVRAHVDAVDDPAERLLALVDRLLRCFDENRALMQIYTLGTHGLPWSIRQTMGEPLVDIYREFLDYVTELAQAAARVGRLGALAPETVALAVVGTVNATAAEWIESGRDEPLSDAAPGIRAVVERLLADAGEE